MPSGSKAKKGKPILILKTMNRQTTLNIGIPISVQTLLNTRALIQSSSGGGKSYLVRKLAEQVCATGVQQIIFDIEGEFITLREKYPFALVSKEGDIPLSLKYADVLATRTLETGLSVIIDLSELQHHERILFTDRFLKTMIAAPKTLWHSCFVYIDEAHLFAPESNKSDAKNSVIDLCTRGRKRGYCAVLATQRLSKLHKDAAAECLNKFIGYTGLDIDRKRAADELGFSSKHDTLELRNLPTGTFYAFGPAVKTGPDDDDIQRFKVSPVVTTHPTSENQVVSLPPTPSAIKSILLQLRDIPEEAEKELSTRQQLQSEVSRLQKELNKLKKQPNGSEDSLQLQRENEALKKQLDQSQADLIQRHDLVKVWVRDLMDIQKMTIELVARMEGVEKSSAFASPSEQIAAAYIANHYKKTFPSELAVIKKNNHQAPSLKKQEPMEPSGISIPQGEKTILIACAMYPGGLRRDQLTVLTTYKRSSRDTYIQKLKMKEFLRQDGDKLFATDEGIRALGSDYHRLPTGIELQQHWMNKLPQGEATILRVLIDQYPGSLNREEISARTEYKRSSRDTYLQKLRAKELIETGGNGQVYASHNLFN
jgi:hypothetical protein